MINSLLASEAILAGAIDSQTLVDTASGSIKNSFYLLGEDFDLIEDIECRGRHLRSTFVALVDLVSSIALTSIFTVGAALQLGSDESWNLQCKKGLAQAAIAGTGILVHFVSMFVLKFESELIRTGVSSSLEFIQNHLESFLVFTAVNFVREHREDTENFMQSNLPEFLSPFLLDCIRAVAESEANIESGEDLLPVLSGPIEHFIVQGGVTLIRENREAANAYFEGTNTAFCVMARGFIEGIANSEEEIRTGRDIANAFRMPSEREIIAAFVDYVRTNYAQVSGYVNTLGAAGVLMTPILLQIAQNHQNIETGRDLFRGFQFGGR